MNQNSLQLILSPESSLTEAFLSYAQHHNRQAYRRTVGFSKDYVYVFAASIANAWHDQADNAVGEKLTLKDFQEITAGIIQAPLFDASSPKLAKLLGKVSGR